MEMPKRVGIIFVTMGVVLVLSAILLFLYNDFEDRRAGQRAESLMDEIQTAVEEETLPAEMPVAIIDGYEYIGYLSIPDLELELPVMAEWDYDRLKISPCRHFGSSETDDLVIAAHNYESHFGLLSKLNIGAEIIFTDMAGNENCYSLQVLDTLAPDAVDAVQNSGYDLVLYTCTFGGATRVVAFCERVADEINGEVSS